MTRRRAQAIAVFAALVAFAPLAQFESLRAQTAASRATQTQTPSSTRARVQRLASDQFGGREAGSEGERLASDYIAGELTRIGAKPLPGRADMFMPFDFTAGSRDGGSTLVIHNAPDVASRAVGPHVQALGFSEDAADVSGRAVFAGYGIVVPASQDFGYDSYAGLDVRDAIVVVLRYFPEDAEPKMKGVLARYSDLRFKAQAARQRGAKGLIVVTGPRSPNAGKTVPLGFDTAAAGSGIAAVSVDASVAQTLFNGAKQSLEEAQKALDSGNPHVSGFVLPTSQGSEYPVRMSVNVIHETQTARNVIAYLPATTSTTGRPKPWVAIGAHFDHLGHGEHGNSLATGSDIGKAHPGADDNASGTAAVLAMAEVLSKQSRPRNVLIALWSAEEIGVVGSEAFIAKPPVPIASIEAYLNYDMVGRMQDNKLTVQATGTSGVWPSVLERANVAAGFDVVLQEDPYQPTDVASFNQASVPSLTFTTGAHADYHKPSDTADKIDYEDLDRVAAFGVGIVQRLMALDQPPAFTKVEQSTQTINRADVRVFTGTVPDYASTAKGLLLSGVVGGGPAEQAGLAKGDVIIEIAGQSITNIYDYTYALELLKIGTPVKVIYLRDGQRRETTLTPSARR
jgi:hypothetical protein